MWAFHLSFHLWLSSSPCPICHSRPCSGPHTPPSTLRAVAHSGGGGCWVVFVALPLVLIIPIPAASHFHPTSSGSWQQFGVLLCWQAWHRSATGRSEAMWQGNRGLWGVYQAGIPLQGSPGTLCSLSSVLCHCCLLFVVCPLSSILHCSLFIVCPLSFVLHPPLFVVCPLLFVVHPPLFVVHCSSFIVCCLSFVLHPLLFVVHCSSFPKQQSSFGLHIQNLPFLAAVAVLGMGAGMVIAVLMEGGWWRWGEERRGSKMVVVVVVVVSGEVGNAAVWFVIHSHPE
jgi:hypothetical protein